MTEQAARSWLSSRPDVLPTLEIHHRAALEILQDHRKTVADLAKVIALDPGMSITLYREVNGKLQVRGKPQVESVQAALSLLGDGAIADLVTEHKVLDQTHPDAARRQDYHQLLSRCYHMLAQLDRFVSLQGVRSINEIRSAALLHNVGEFWACLFDPEHYRKYQAQFHDIGIDANSAKSVFGFDLHQLGRLLVEIHYLPVLVGESLDERVPPGRKARLIQLAADVSHHAEEGWYHSAMKATEEVCAAYLNQSLDGFDRALQQVAIQAARDCPFDDVLPAAARLIMLPDRQGDAVQAPARIPDLGDASGFELGVKALLKSPRASQAQVLDLLLTHLHDDLHLSRAVLLLLSRDRSKLGARAGKGLDEHSPVRQLVIDVDRAGVLNTLLSKPQALWIDAENYHKFEPALPSRFKSTFLHENFFLMSLFVGDRPIGLIFADRALSVTRLDKETFLRFKSAILLTNRALAYLAQRKQQATA